MSVAVDVVSWRRDACVERNRETNFWHDRVFGVITVSSGGQDDRRNSTTPGKREVLSLHERWRVVCSSRLTTFSDAHGYKKENGMNRIAPSSQQVQEWWVPPWTLLLALVALADIINCFMQIVWPSLDLFDAATIISPQCPSSNQSANDPRRHFPKFLPGGHHDHRHRDNATCPATNSTASSISLRFVGFLSSLNQSKWQAAIGVAFCVLCVVEAFRQAFISRKKAMEMEALDEVEKKLTRLVQVTRRKSIQKLNNLHLWAGNIGASAPCEQKDDDIADTMHKCIRVWTPVAFTLFVWLVLVPWPLLWLPQTYSCMSDPSWATAWITRGSRQLARSLEEFSEALIDFAWKIAVPFHFWQPVPLIKRLRILARWARYIRYAGPLLRLCLKLHDQFWVFTKTWRQSCNVQINRAKRLAHRSMIFADIARIESIAKVQTTLASLPSQLFSKGHEIGALLAAKKEQGVKLQKRLAWLKMKLIHRSSRNISSSEIYDRVMDLAQEVKSQVKSAFWNAHLISPQTRFSVAWRIVVTCTLLSELYRLYWSWELTGTFDMRYTDMTRRLLGLCQSKSQPFRQWIGKVFKLPYNHPLLDTCRQSSPSSQLSLKFARMSEIGIDLVGFLDIFVWFYTGELDETGLIIPKPFFSRCILPGTLTQVLDHPTVTQVLPRLIGEIWRFAGIFGYGRVIRWALALAPAIELWAVSPIYYYLFKPMDPKEYMTYSESLGLMRTFSSTAAATPWPSNPSYPTIPSPRPFKTITSASDLLDSSMRSLTEDTEAYGLFY